MNRLIELIANLGARHAEPGEFTKRALLNGKISLLEAEMLNETIKEENELLFKLKHSSFNGQIRSLLESNLERFLVFKARLDAEISFSEEELSEAAFNSRLEEVKDFIKDFGNYLEVFEKQQSFKNGINIAIIGKSNSGKSSLFNNMIEKERSIVDDISGTTRDVIAETVKYKNLLINFFDTAGFKEYEHRIDEKAIKKTEEVIKSANILLYLIDGEKGPDAFDLNKIRENEKTVIPIFSRADRIKTAWCYDFLAISNITKAGIDELWNHIYQLAQKLLGRAFDNYYFTRRHSFYFREILEDLYEMEKLLNLKGETDKLDYLSDKVLEKMEFLTGVKYDEKIIDKIFKDFCIGK